MARTSDERRNAPARTRGTVLTRCYLCGWEGEASHCGLLDCPMKNAAPQGSSTDESRRTLERAQSGQPLGNDAIGKVKCGDSSVSRSVEHEPAAAAPCPTCKGIRYRTCSDCKQGVNSFGDFREGRLKPEMYPTLSDWYRQERKQDRDVERPLQPDRR